MADHHSDDFELGNRIAAKGHRVEFIRKNIWMVFPNETAGGLLSAASSAGQSVFATCGNWDISDCLLRTACPGPFWLVLRPRPIGLPPDMRPRHTCFLPVRDSLDHWAFGESESGNTPKSLDIGAGARLVQFRSLVAGFFSNTIHWHGAGSPSECTKGCCWSLSKGMGAAAEATVSLLSQPATLPRRK